MASSSATHIAKWFIVILKLNGRWTRSTKVFPGKKPVGNLYGFKMKQLRSRELLSGENCSRKFAWVSAITFPSNTRIFSKAPAQESPVKNAWLSRYRLLLLFFSPSLCLSFLGRVSWRSSKQKHKLETQSENVFKAKDEKKEKKTKKKAVKLKDWNVLLLL